MTSLVIAHAAKVIPTSGSCQHPAWHRFQTFSDGSAHSPIRDWTSSSLAFPIGCGSRVRMTYFVFRTSIASACSCPVGLSASGKLIDPRTSLRVLPACGRDTTQRLTAHTGRACFQASGSPVPASLPLTSPHFA